MVVLGAEFFRRETLVVARDLIGKLLVHETPAGRLSGRVVETEAYTQDDPAFHGWSIVDRETGFVRPGGRAYDLFGPPGSAYVYLNYGTYWLLNVVTEPEGVGGAVLIRAVEPIEGIDVMRAHRTTARRDRDLTSGPGKLTRAFGLDQRFHGTMLTGPPLFFASNGQPSPPSIATSSRIGLSRGVEHPWRFYMEDSPYISRGRPSDLAAGSRLRRTGTRR
jgi:DNA-3-methyladenine glycosylase